MLQIPELAVDDKGGVDVYRHLCPLRNNVASHCGHFSVVKGIFPQSESLADYRAPRIGVGGFNS